MEYLYGKSFSLANFDQEARYLSHLSPCQPLPDINWSRGREMKDSLDTAQCAGTTCQAAEHTEPRGCPAGVRSTEFLLCLLPSLPKGQPALAPPASCRAGRCLLRHSQPLPWQQLQSYWKGRTPHRGQVSGSPLALLAPTLHLSLLGTRDSSGEKRCYKDVEGGLHCPAQGWPVPGDARKTGERKEERPMPPKAFLQWEPVHSQTSPRG